MVMWGWPILSTATMIVQSSTKCFGCWFFSKPLTLHLFFSGLDFWYHLILYFLLNLFSTVPLFFHLLLEISFFFYCSFNSVRNPIMAARLSISLFLWKSVNDLDDCQSNIGQIQGHLSSLLIFWSNRITLCYLRGALSVLSFLGILNSLFDTNV